MAFLRIFSLSFSRLASSRLFLGLADASVSVFPRPAKDTPTEDPDRVEAMEVSDTPTAEGPGRVEAKDESAEKSIKDDSRPFVRVVKRDPSMTSKSDALEVVEESSEVEMVMELAESTVEMVSDSLSTSGLVIIERLDLFLESYLETGMVNN